MSSLINFSSRTLAELFPFHFVLDAHLRIIGHGPSLLRIASNIRPGVAVEEIFKPHRPHHALEFATLRNSHEVLFLIKERASGVLFRGQFVTNEDKQTLVFVGSPWLLTVADLEKYGLTSAHFAVFDPALDLLQVIQSQRSAVEDLRKLTDVLETQRGELRIANERLRAKELEQNELIQTAEKANSAKGEFLARMSHEIRTPMNGVIGMLEALVNTPLSGEQLDYLRTAHTSADTLLRLINDILDYSKVEAGKLTLEHIAYDLHALLEHTVSLWRGRCNEKHIDISLDIADDVPRWVKGDPARLSQVLGNLTNNAVKFTQSGTIILHARALGLSANVGNARLQFAVSDTGVGIEKSAQERLFNPFSQADDSTNRIFGGTGLGLAICQQLVTLMGGARIALDSALGQGSRFYFDIEIAIPTTDERADVKAAAMPLTLRSSERGSRILAVDDNDTNRKVLTVMLDRLGLSYETAENGFEAVHKVKNGNFDMVLMDCHMPIVDGLDATVTIRGWETSTRRPRVPIVAVTASAFIEDRERCRIAGMDEFLAKPITMAKLTAVLDRWKIRATTAKSAVEPVISSPIDAVNEVNVAPAELFDHAQLDEMRMLAGEGFAELFKKLQANVRDGVQAMRTAAHAGDADALRNAAHKVKGSLLTIGANAAGESAKELELLGRAGSCSNAAQLIDRFEIVYRLTEAKLKTILSEKPVQSFAVADDLGSRNTA